MANTCESLINVVIHNKLKMLKSLTKKGMWSVQGFEVLLTQTPRPPAKRRSLPHAWYTCGTWETNHAPGCQESLSQGRPIAWLVKDEGKKRKPPCNGEDRGCLVREHYPTRKRADFPLVFRRESA
jgi:hypothetical protein